jgi:transcription elongation factor Elf1
MISNKQYKCPKCKHTMPVNKADFIKGVAMVSCGKCGTGSFTIEETLLKL